MSGADLFSAGFAWDDVASDATRAATPRPTSFTGLSQGHATPSATHDAPSFSASFAWSDDAVASVAGVATSQAGARVSQPLVAGAATPRATRETADFCGAKVVRRASVADVASVAAWAENVERMRRATCPSDVDPRTWRELCADATVLLRNWGADLVDLGWNTLEVFGVTRNPRARNVDVLGILPLLHGAQVEAIDADTASVRVNARDTLTFYRKLLAPGGVPVWDWIDEVKLSRPCLDRGSGVAPAAHTPARPPQSTGFRFRSGS